MCDFTVFVCAFPPPFGCSRRKGRRMCQKFPPWLGRVVDVAGARVVSYLARCPTCPAPPAAAGCNVSVVCPSIPPAQGCRRCWEYPGGNRLLHR
eukprot:2997593-Pyramimonas_sp.AAC.1